MYQVHNVTQEILREFMFIFSISWIMSSYWIKFLNWSSASLIESYRIVCLFKKISGVFHEARQTHLPLQPQSWVNYPWTTVCLQMFRLVTSWLQAKTGLLPLPDLCDGLRGRVKEPRTSWQERKLQKSLDSTYALKVPEIPVRYEVGCVAG